MYCFMFILGSSGDFGLSATVGNGSENLPKGVNLVSQYCDRRIDVVPGIDEGIEVRRHSDTVLCNGGCSHGNGQRIHDKAAEGRGDF